MDFFLLLKTWSKILVKKKISENVIRKYKLKLNQAKQSATDALKTISQNIYIYIYFRKLQKQRVIWLPIKLLIRLQKSQDLYHGIVQGQLQMKQKIMDLMEKYQKKHICFQKNRQQIIDILWLI